MLTAITGWIMKHRNGDFNTMRWVLCWAMLCDVVIFSFVVFCWTLWVSKYS